MFSLLILLSRFLGILPLGARRALGTGLGWIWFHCIRFRRQIVLENLRLAFGDEKSEQEVRAMAAHNFRHYALTCLEIVQSVTWRKEDYERNVPCEGIEHLVSALAKGNGVFGLNCHLGNWEWVIGSVMSRGIPGDVIVKHSKNASLDRFLLSYRQNMGIGVFYESGTIKQILSSLSKGRLVGFILDQFMGPPIGLPVKFFGKTAGTAVGLALLTEKRNVPIVPMYSYRDSKGVLRAVVEPELVMPTFSPNREDRLYEKTQFFNDVIEARVRLHPDQWLWLHRRWKPYRGEPRWAASAATAVCSFLLLLGCSSQSLVETPTGIAFPPEPEVSLPDEKPVEVVVPKENKTKATKKELPALNPVVKFRVYKPDQIPFEVGERQVISLDWTALRAGDVRMEVREGFPFKGRPTFKFWGHVLSSAVVDAIYHVDNTIESFVDKQWLLPYRFFLHMVESHQLKETRASFDHKQSKVHYWSKRVSKKWGDEVQDRVDGLGARSVDMFSALYFARLLDFEKGKAVEFPVYENGQNLTVSLLPVANEIVQTKAGVFQCWKLAVSVKLENVLKPTGDMHLWLSDDFKKYIVKFEAKLKIGSLRGELTSLRERL